MFGSSKKSNTEAGTHCARSSSCASTTTNTIKSADGIITLSAVLLFIVSAALVLGVLMQSVGIIISIILVVRLIVYIIKNNIKQPYRISIGASA